MNNDNNATLLDSGRYSHKACTHPSTAAHRHNCRYEMAVRNFAAHRAANPVILSDAPIVIKMMNEI